MQEMYLYPMRVYGWEGGGGWWGVSKGGRTNEKRTGCISKAMKLEEGWRLRAFPDERYGFWKFTTPPQNKVAGAAELGRKFHNNLNT